MSSPDQNFHESLEIENSLSSTSSFYDLTALSNLDSETPVQLKDWSAQDFSNIYVRFRPHLDKHARKFVSNPSIAEEVVQDAFLYLMTALPDLDSEVGVLRFLKWKTRLLCLDVIRAQGGNPIRNAEPLEESTAAHNPDLSESIERADDAAIVRLALAQLSPRHREAIVATVFEEKSSQQAAEEMGLSENAFRQLLLRARRSFKTVFIGEAEAADMSVSEALNLAAKRHRLKLISGTTLVGLLLVALTLPIPENNPTSLISASSSSGSGLGQLQSGLVPSVPSPLSGGEELSSVAASSPDSAKSELPDLEEGATPQPVIEERPALPARSVLEEENDAGLEFAFEAALLSDLREAPLNLVTTSTLNYSQQGPGPELRVPVSSHVQLVAETNGCDDTYAFSLCKVYLEDTRNGKNLVWLSTNFAFAQMTAASGEHIYEVVATDFLVGDFGGEYGNVAVSQVSVSEVSLLRFRLSLEDQGVQVSEIEFVQTRT